MWCKHVIDHLHDLTDYELLQQLSRGTLDALSALHERYAGYALALAYETLRDRGRAEDVVQEAFVSIWRFAEGYDAERGDFRLWLFSIIRHRCIDELRRQRVRPYLLQMEAWQLIPGPSDVWQEVLQRLTSDVVRGALSQLPPEQRETIELAHFYGYTQIQISEHLGVPLGTVKSRMRLAVVKLRDLLASHE